MAAPRFHCRDGWIRDEHGRIRMFRGANVSGRAKLPPFLPFDDPAAFDRLAQWGWNAVRLLVMWEGVAPERGVVDESYLARVRALAEAAGSRGLHVVVDLHQDLFSRVHGGDGAPDWAVAARGKPANGRSWFADYALSPAVWRSFAAFWRDDDGIRSEFLACLRAVMTTMRDVPMVVGYDPFNEPMTEITGLVAFERGPLADLYRACIRLRDELDPGRLLFLEPTPLAAFGLPTALPTLEGENLVYAPHIYDAPAIVASRYMPKLSSFPFTLRALLKESEWREEPLFVGEFGVLNGVDGDARMMEHQCRMLDRHFVSWTVWHYNPTAVDWNAEDASIVEADGGERPWTGALVRPYPRALAGAPLGWDSHPRRTWSLEYAPRGGVGLAGAAVTELVVPARWSGGECRVHAVGADARWIDAATPGGAALVEVTARAGVERVRVELERG
jgi:endoglycosylceramidase